MSATDDPSEPPDRTIVRTPQLRPQPSAATENSGSQGGGPVPMPARESTVFDPGINRQVPPGWSSGTVVFHGSDPGAVAEPSPALQQDTLLAAAGGVKYACANPIVAAAAPLLMLLGQLRLTPVDRKASSLARYIADAVETFDRAVAKATSARRMRGSQNLLFAKPSMISLATCPGQKNPPGLTIAWWCSSSIRPPPAPASTRP